MVVTIVPAMKFGVRALELIEFIFFFTAYQLFRALKLKHILECKDNYFLRVNIEYIFRTMIFQIQILLFTP